MFYSHYGDLGHAYPSSSDSVIIGLCVGLLSSAAVSSSKTIGELIPIAVETVVLALRLGLCVHTVRKLVDTGNSSSSSWSALVSGINESEASDKIQEFSSQQVSFCSSKAFEKWTQFLTILGDPSFFTALYQCCVWKWGYHQCSPDNA